MRRVRLILLCLVLLLFTGGAFILTTGSGLNLVFKTLAAIAGKNISAEEYAGSLLGGFEINGFEYADDETDINISQLRADLDIAGLFIGKIDVNYLHANHIHVLRKKEPSGTQFDLQTLFPSVRIKVDDFQAGDLQIRNTWSDDTINIRKLALVFSLTGKALKLKKMQVDAEQFELTGNGQVDLSLPMAIDISTAWKLVVNDGKILKGKTSFKGNSKELNAIVQVNEPFDGSVELVIHDLLKQITWEGQADFSEINPAVLGEGFPEVILGSTLRLRGDMTSAGVDGLLEITLQSRKLVLEINADGLLNDEGYEINSTFVWDALSLPVNGNNMSIEFPTGDFKLHVINNEFDFASQSALVLNKQLQGSWQLQGKGNKNTLDIDQLVMQAGNGSITATGTIDWSGKDNKGRFDIKWQDMAYPFTGNEPMMSSDGEFSLVGSFPDYSVAGKTVLKGQDIPVIDLSLTGKGSNEALQINPVRLSTLNGEVAGTGRLNWKEPILLDVTWRGRNLDPGKHWKDWPGKLELAGTTRINKENDEYRLTLNDMVVSGTLRNYPVRLHLDSALVKDTITINRFDLTSSSSKLDLSGRLARQYDLKWNIDVPDMGNLFPQASGTLAGKGEMAGTLEKPRFAGTLQGKDIQTAWIHLQNIKTDVDLDFMQKHDVGVHLDVSGLAYKDYVLGNLQFSVSGSEKEHGYTLDAGNDQVKLKLSGKGSFVKGNWDGTIQNLLFEHTEFGDWKNTRAIQAYLHPEEKGVGETCLKNQQSSLCFSADWNDRNNWTGRLTASAMPLNVIDLFAPEQVQVNGRFDLNLNGKRQEGKIPSATGNLILTPGKFVFQVDKETEEKIAFNSGHASFQLYNSSLESNMSLILDQPGVQPLKANFIVSGLDRFPVEPSGLSLAGTVTGAIDDLAFVSSLTPYVTDVTGRADINLEVQGKLKEPEVSGQLQLSNTGFLVPDLGIEIKNMDAAGRTTPGGQYEVRGQFQSGEGTTNLYATMTDNKKGIPVINAQLQGEKFEVINLPEMWALTSPDVILKLTGGSADLNGKVLVTNAIIDLDEIAATTTSNLSGDVVLVNQEEAKKKTAKVNAINTDLHIEFGDDIKVKGQGITGNVKGTLDISSGKDAELLGNGEIYIENGQFSAYGQSLAIEEGRLIYRKAKLDNPELSIKAVRHVGDITAGVNVAGHMTNPVVTLFSSPVMSQDEALSYVVFGRPLSSLSSGEGGDLIGAAAALGLQNSGFLTDSLAAKFGIDTLQVETNGTATDASLVVGKYLTPKLYLSYGIGLFESLSAAKLRYDLSKNWALEAERGAEVGADLLYKIEN